MTGGGGSRQDCCRANGRTEEVRDRSCFHLIILRGPRPSVGSLSSMLGSLLTDADSAHLSIYLTFIHICLYVQSLVQLNDFYHYNYMFYLIGLLDICILIIPCALSVFPSYSAAAAINTYISLLGSIKLRLDSQGSSNSSHFLTSTGRCKCQGVFVETLQ